jgi:hypothetical protein
MVDIPAEFLTGYVPSTNKLGTLPPQPAFRFLRIIEFRGVAIKVSVAQKIQKNLIA